MPAEEGGVCPRCGERFSASDGPAPPPLSSRPPAVRVSQARPAANAPTHGPAIVSMVLGISSYLCTGPFCSIPGLIIGAMSLSRIRKARPMPRGEGYAIAGIVLSGINLALVVMLLPAIMLPALARAREATRRADCALNLRQLGIVMKMFANESEGEYFPVLSPEPGKLMFANTSAVSKLPVYPEFLTDAVTMACPSDSHAPALQEAAVSSPESLLDDDCYFYLGYALQSDDDMETFAELYRKTIEEGGDFERDLHVSESSLQSRSKKLYRLRDGVDRKFTGDTGVPAPGPEDIPLMIERLGNHIPGGANVLYMDGRVQFIRYPGKWPMTERTIGILQALDGGYWPPREVDLGHN